MSLSLKHVLMQQAAALQETQVRIKQTATLGSQEDGRAQQTTRANQLSQETVIVVQGSLEGLREIGQ